MKTKPKTPFTLENLDVITEAYFRQIELRNRSVYASRAYTKAEANIDAIEAGLSILVFGFTGASFTECLDALNR